MHRHAHIYQAPPRTTTRLLRPCKGQRQFLKSQEQLRTRQQRRCQHTMPQSKPIHDRYHQHNKAISNRRQLCSIRITRRTRRRNTIQPQQPMHHSPATIQHTIPQKATPRRRRSRCTPTCQRPTIMQHASPRNHRPEQRGHNRPSRNHIRKVMFQYTIHTRPPRTSQQRTSQRTHQAQLYRSTRKFPRMRQCTVQFSMHQSDNIRQSFKQGH